MDLDHTYVRLRAVRAVNIYLFSLGIIQGFVIGMAVGFLVWGGWR